MNFHEKRTLGRTGLGVGRLGISSSFGAPVEAYDEAFERGCNYFTWGTFIRGRSSGMKESIRNTIEKGQRDRLVLAIYSYAHDAFLTETSLVRGLKALGTDYADILILGYFPRRPPQRIIDGAMGLKRKGLARFIGISSHNRGLFPELHRDGLIDVFYLRYNAAHRGAETEVFPFVRGADRPGIVSYTATRWQKLIDPKRTPKNIPAPTATHCYRFVLSHPQVDVCMMGAASVLQMKENLGALDRGPMTVEELSHMRWIGDYVRGFR